MFDWQEAQKLQCLGFNRCNFTRPFDKELEVVWGEGGKVTVQKQKVISHAHGPDGAPVQTTGTVRARNTEGNRYDKHGGPS